MSWPLAPAVATHPRPSPAHASSAEAGRTLTPAALRTPFSAQRGASRRALTGTELVDAASWLASFNRPTRIVWGTRDRNFTLELGRRLAAALPRAELTEEPGATTFVSIDQPEAVTAAITSVIADIKPDPAGEP
jgi:pimeloyl-ACP methyl ester carboxylesterase